MAYCEDCGTRLVPGARFCEGCGAPVLAEPPTRRAGAVSQAIRVEHGPPVPASEPSVRPHRTGLVVLAGTAGVLLAVVVVLAFVLVVGRGAQPQQASVPAARATTGTASTGGGEAAGDDTPTDGTVTATVTESPPTATNGPGQSGTPAPRPDRSGQGGAAMPAGQYRLQCASSPSGLPKMFNESSSRSGARLAQYSLRAVGLWSDRVYPTYDAATRAAVRRFQAKVGAEVDGLTGPETWGKFQAVLCGQ